MTAGVPVLSLSVAQCQKAAKKEKRETSTVDLRYSTSITEFYCTSRRCKTEAEGIPTNIVSVHLLMDCPNARAGVKIVKKENP